VEEANLSRNIFMLRKALGERPQDHCYVVTVPGRGYRLAESVQTLLENQPDGEFSLVAAKHSDEFIMLEHDLAFLKDDHAAMERAAARARERPAGDPWISN
jgi:DNA-binding winged helix-turn-helix (wHTH) protein